MLQSCGLIVTISGDVPLVVLGSGVVGSFTPSFPEVVPLCTRGAVFWGGFLVDPPVLVRVCTVRSRGCILTLVVSVSSSGLGVAIVKGSMVTVDTIFGLVM
jgi:hypothetical protein